MIRFHFAVSVWGCGVFSLTRTAFGCVCIIMLGVDWACAGRRRASPEPMARVLIPDAIPAIEFLALNKKNKNEIYSRR